MFLPLDFFFHPCYNIRDWVKYRKKFNNLIFKILIKYGLKSCTLSRWKGNPVRIRSNRHYCIWQVGAGYAIGQVPRRSAPEANCFRCIISQDTCRVFFGLTQLWCEECNRFIDRFLGFVGCAFLLSAKVCFDVSKIVCTLLTARG